jgi:hypothetical protein
LTGCFSGDVNNDGYPDIYAANDSMSVIIPHQSRMASSKMSWKIACSRSVFVMGADIADINNDGYPEIFTTDMLPDDDYRLKHLGLLTTLICIGTN